MNSFSHRAYLRCLVWCLSGEGYVSKFLWLLVGFNFWCVVRLRGWRLVWGFCYVGSLHRAAYIKATDSGFEISLVHSWGAEAFRKDLDNGQQTNNSSVMVPEELQNCTSLILILWKSMDSESGQRGRCSQSGDFLVDTMYWWGMGISGSTPILE
jgi:hypothetical protein